MIEVDFRHVREVDEAARGLLNESLFRLREDGYEVDVIDPNALL